MSTDVKESNRDIRKEQVRRPPASSSPDVMKKIAAPMVGGMLTSGLLELLVLPAVYALWKGRGLPR